MPSLAWRNAAIRSRFSFSAFLDYRAASLCATYTRAGLELLAAVDEAHETLSGPATRRILQREYRDYGKPEYERLAAISISHLYNLRQSPRYREHI